MREDRVVDRANSYEEDVETAAIDLASLRTRVPRGGPAAEVALLDVAGR